MFYYSVFHKTYISSVSIIFIFSSYLRKKEHDKQTHSADQQEQS